MYLLYSLMTAAALVLLSPYFFVRGLMTGKYLGNFRERTGWRFPAKLLALEKSCGAIWMHAVSVGEVLAVLPLARRLKERFPERSLVISTTTKTGQRLAKERATFADAIFYFPLDFAGAAARAIRAVQPALIVIVETEIWPNFLRQARRARAPVVFVNGRVSEKSHHNYGRLFALTGGVIRKFLARVMQDAEAFLMQSDADAARLLELGAPRERVIVTGNLKYDLRPPEEGNLPEWLAAQASQANRHPLLVAGSVTANEESKVLQAFSAVEQQFPRALLVLAPRKPERFVAAAEIIETSRRRVIRRSGVSINGTREPAFADARSVFLLDSMGELASIYRIADAVFVGGSLVPDGGHNILEPAAFGKPPVFGASMENFREMAERFVSARAGVQVATPEELGSSWVDLIENSVRRAKMGNAARELVEQSRGATDRTLEHLERILKLREDGA